VLSVQVLQVTLACGHAVIVQGKLCASDAELAKMSGSLSVHQLVEEKISHGVTQLELVLLGHGG
jgi:hypothetical protein